jgi:hypothetical protein
MSPVLKATASRVHLFACLTAGACCCHSQAARHRLRYSACENHVSAAHGFHVKMQPAVSRTLGRELQRSACSVCALINAPLVETCTCSATRRGYSSNGQPAGDGSSYASSGNHRADGELISTK